MAEVFSDTSPVIIRLKPLDSVLSDDIVANSWIAKPYNVMDGQEETTDDDTGFLGGQQWDCDGCPPPFFDLPPPPRPPFMEDPDYCASTTATGGSPYDSCDNPLIVDSHGLSIQNDVLHVVLIVITSLVSVLLILIVAGIVWRKRSCLLGSLRSSTKPHSHPAFDTLGGGLGPSPTPHRHQFSTSQKFQTQYPSNSFNPDDSVELNEHPSRHVYTNPNYPTLEIGGLPFYLMPAGPQKSSSSSPSERDTSFSGPATSQVNPYEHEYVSNASQKSSSCAPIYEDIDRMCTYRGAPPPPAPAERNTNNPGVNATVMSSEDRTYYNVYPGAPHKRLSRPSSGGSSSSPLNCGTSSSEVSFESGSSPRHVAVPGGGHHVIVNPLSTRLKTLSPTSMRSPARTTASTLSSAAASPSKSSSVYYYSDTLRPRNGRNLIDSDSGISNSQDTPPPLPALPSSRLADAASPRSPLEGSRSRTGGRTRGRKASHDPAMNKVGLNEFRSPPQSRGRKLIDRADV